MTFSIVARCPQTGMFGVAVSSSSMAVAARCAHAREGAGAMASQNITDPSLGQRGLDLLQGGLTASQAITRLREVARDIEYRQIAAVDQQGGVAAFSGRKTLGRYSSAFGQGTVASGNLLSSEGVPAAMIAAYDEAADRPFGDRLVGALQAAVKAGGEEGPVRSAGLLIVRDVTWPVVDLRIDWSDDPIAELASLWELWKPQMDDYVTRALDPASAPAYGVPGDP